MSQYPCELVEDLLPLYLEDDLSPASREIIEKHLQECPRCRELTSDYQYDWPSLTGFKETLPEASTFKSFMGRLKKTALVAAVLLVLAVISIGVASYYAGKSQTANEHLLFAREKGDVAAFLYENTPGYRRAEEEGNVFEINKEVAIPGGRGTLTVDKVWYTSENVHLFYHIDGEIPTRIDGTLQWAGGESTMNHHANLNIGEGIVYRDVFYSRLTFGNVQEARQAAEEKAREKLKLEARLNYDDDLSAGGPGEVTLPPVEFTVDFEPGREKTYTLDLQGSVSLGEYGELVLHRLEMEPQQSYLTFDLVHAGGNQLHYLAATLATDKGDERRLWIPPEPTGEESPFYRLKFEALDNIPGTINLKIHGVQLITGEQLTFNIPVERFHGELKDPMQEEKPHKKIGTVHGIDFYLHHLWWDERGLGFSMARDVDASSNPLDRISTRSVTNTWQQQRAREREQFKNWRLPNVISVSDESDREAGVDDYGSSGGGRDEGVKYIAMTVKKEFVESAEVIDVKLSNITRRLTGPWTGEIKVEK